MKWSSQYVTWCQFNAIKHFKWNWSCPFQLWLFGDNQFCNCFPLCISSKIRASSRCVPGLVWLFPKRAGKAKLFVLFLDQSRCESDYSPTADRLSGRTRELASLGSGSSSRRVHVSFTITFLTAVGKQPRQWFSLHLLFLGETQSEGDVRECIQVRPFHAPRYLLSRPLGHLPGVLPRAGAIIPTEGGFLPLEVWQCWAAQ